MHNVNNAIDTEVRLSWTEAEKILTDLVRAKGAPIGYANTMSRILRWSEALCPGFLARSIITEKQVMVKKPLVLENDIDQRKNVKKIHADFSNSSWYEFGPGFTDWLQGEAQQHGECLGVASDLKSLDGVLYCVCEQLLETLCGKIDLHGKSHVPGSSEGYDDERTSSFIGTLWFNYFPEEIHSSTVASFNSLVELENYILCNYVSHNVPSSFFAKCSLTSGRLSTQANGKRYTNKPGVITFVSNSNKVYILHKNEIAETISAVKKAGIPMPLHTYNLLREQAHEFLVDSSARSKAQAG